MKVATVILLVVNVLLGGWLVTHQYTDRPTDSPGPSTVPDAAESLTLLRERSPTAVPPAGSLADTPIAERTDPATATGLTRQVQSVPAPSSDPLVQQPSPDLAVDDSSAGAPADSVALGPDPEGTCHTVGPFPAHARAQDVVSALAAVQVESVLRTAQIAQPSGYWVYLPSMPSPAAKRIVDDLSAKGVKDYFLGRQNFISLGVFSDRYSAERRLRAIADLGYQPKLEPRFLTQEVFWVDVAESPGVPITQEQWTNLLGSEAGIRRQSIACE